MEFTTKFVNEISGSFVVPAYQRGYRWGRNEVLRLLEDVYQFGQSNKDKSKTYCLQPIVVRKQDEGVFHLIDGQQRLTTLYLFYRYAHSADASLAIPSFSLEYETRPDSADFLKDFPMEKSRDNIDFWFFSEAWKTIETWFRGEPSPDLGKFYQYLSEQVKIIWYEVSGEGQDSDIKLFTRLNIGKIPLTNSELVKALFLCNNQKAGISDDRKKEIAFQWDSMEKELHEDSFWFFLTNKAIENFQTRIDLVLNLMVKIPENCREKYYTFFEFNKMYAEGIPVESIWEDIQDSFLVLKGWFKNHELYHKIGYLIASGYVPGTRESMLQYIYNQSKEKTKTEFKRFLDEEIKKSIRLDKDRNYADLRYSEPPDKKRLQRLLLLFNVESVRQIEKETERFPFDRFKFVGKREEVWSLEHIHAQNSDVLKKQKDWSEWLESHIPFVQQLQKKEEDTDKKGRIESLIEKMKSAQQKAASGKNGALTTREFVDIYEEVMGCLPKTKLSIDSISNLALLNVGNNAALSNSVFAVKRDKVIEMDKRGEYIPYCTKMVFLKYYSSSNDTQLLFWGPDDRKSYIDQMNKTLETYLDEKISVSDSEDWQ